MTGSDESSMPASRHSLPSLAPSAASGGSQHKRRFVPVWRTTVRSGKIRM